MPEYRLDSLAYDVMHKSVLLDTNVLVGAFDPEDSNHEEARFFIDESQYQLLVPLAVIVEAWGFLVGSRKKWNLGFEMLAWLNTPGRAIIIASKGDNIPEVQGLAQIIEKLDCVDAVLVLLSEEIRLKCGFSAGPPIATYDLRDFYKLAPKVKAGLKVLTVDSEQEIPLN